MARTRKPPDPSTFSPSLHEIWRKAADGPLRIEIGTRELATRARHRLYSLRKSLTFHGYSLARSIAHLKITIVASASTGAHYLEFTPSDGDIDEVLERQLGTATSAPDPTTFLNDPLPTPADLADDLNKVENEYLNPKPKKKS